MFGHKWEPAHGTITGVEPDPRQHHELVYLVDVPLDSRGGLRARVAPTRSMSPDLPPGTQVRVEVNAKTGDVRFAADPVEGFRRGRSKRRPVLTGAMVPTGRRPARRAA